MMENELDDDDLACPKCGQDMANEDCSGLGCEDGEYLDEDGINGDEWVRCDECRGTGRMTWCRSCGWDDVFKQYLNSKPEPYAPPANDSDDACEPTDAEPHHD
jgi:predicted RNA-binding Zn-ribbon protein involved in translation (DUF1610 family)